MIDFPITALLDESLCTLWLERHLHPNGVRCPHCASTERRLFREQGYFPAYRCRTCHGYDTLLTGTVFEKTRQRPATLVLPLRGIAKGEPTARLARELAGSRKQLHPLRQRIQANLNETAPTDAMRGPAFEADELYQNAGEKSTPHRDPSDPPRRRANKRTGHGTYASDRPPIISVVSRETGESTGFGCAITPTGGRAAASSPNTCRPAAPGPIPTSGRAIGAAIRSMRPSVTGCTNGHGMMMPMADVRGTATPVKELVRGSGPTCASSVECISSTCISMSRRMMPCSILNASHPC
jgi:transposase-like protein